MTGFPRGILRRHLCPDPIVGNRPAEKNNSFTAIARIIYPWHVSSASKRQRLNRSGPWAHRPGSRSAGRENLWPHRDWFHTQSRCKKPAASDGEQ